MNNLVKLKIFKKIKLIRKSTNNFKLKKAKEI